MAVKIRLTRMGRHKDPFYRIVVADSRFARDGRYIEQIGYFDPSKATNAVTLDEELTLKWLKNGATPSDSVKTMLSEAGILAKLAESKAKKAKSTTVKTKDFSKKEEAPKAKKATKKAPVLETK